MKCKAGWVSRVVEGGAGSAEYSSEYSEMSHEILCLFIFVFDRNTKKFNQYLQWGCVIPEMSPRHGCCITWYKIGNCNLEEV